VDSAIARRRNRAVKRAVKRGPRALRTWTREIQIPHLVLSEPEAIARSGERKRAKANHAQEDSRVGMARLHVKSVSSVQRQMGGYVRLYLV